MNKYHNKKTVVDGITFDSKREATRYGALKMLERVKRISNLRTQVKYPLIVNEIKVCDYVADFVYEEAGRTIVEDVKGMRTRIYSVKKKLMKAVLGISILETR